MRDAKVLERTSSLPATGPLCFVTILHHRQQHLVIVTSSARVVSVFGRIDYTDPLVCLFSCRKSALSRRRASVRCVKADATRLRYSHLSKPDVCLVLVYFFDCVGCLLALTFPAQKSRLLFYTEKAWAGGSSALARRENKVLCVSVVKTDSLAFLRM